MAWKKPGWVNGVIYISLIVALTSFLKSCNEQRFVAAWAENFVAGVFILGGPTLGIVCGAFVGMRVAKKTSKLYEKSFPKRIYFRKETYLPGQVLGWIVGIVIGLMIAFIIIAIGNQIPGVGWRMSDW